MATDSQTKDTQSKPQSGKKVYEKPAIVYRGPLEAMAGACGRFPPGPGKGVSPCTAIRS